MKVLLIIGSRPEAIKMAPIILAMQAIKEEFEAIICSTGQQRDMLPQALKEFSLQPDFDLDVMEPNQTLAGLTSKLFTELDSIIVETKPDWLLVQGDTTSAMCGALAGYYRMIRVAHVEAGLRTRNIYSPFPEEVNRRIISQCASLHFAPTEGCRQNLLNEGTPSDHVFVTGNTIVDALLWIWQRVKQDESGLPLELQGDLTGRRIVLVTSHRRENFGINLRNICFALKDLVAAFEDILIVYPVHPNPNVMTTVYELLSGHSRIILLSPMPYRSLIELMGRSYLILSDSGGLQEEAPSFGKPLLVLRDTTERPEGIESGAALLVGTEREKIFSSASLLLSDKVAYDLMASVPNPYGDGQAANRIVDSIRNFPSS